jgi:hypothetical protein
VGNGTGSRFRRFLRTDKQAFLANKQTKGKTSDRSMIFDFRYIPMKLKFKPQPYW